MEYAKLRNTDIEISKLCIGCMSLARRGLCMIGHLMRIRQMIW